MDRTVIGMFDFPPHAEHVISELTKAGFEPEFIAIMALDEQGAFEEPGIGPLRATGLLAEALEGDTSLVQEAGLVGALFGAGVSREDAHAYAEALRRGATMVAVDTDLSRSEEVVEIMHHCGAMDIDRRAELYRRQGVQRFESDRPRLTQAQVQIERERDFAQDQVIANEAPGASDKLRRPVFTGGIRIVAHVHPWKRLPQSENRLRPR